MELKILIIDDDPDILMTTSSLLKKKGYGVIEAKSGEEALESLKSLRPDLIITDVLLPQMNGYELVKEIRKSSFTSDIPILVITGRGQMKETFDLLKVNGFIAKPFSPEEFLQKIREILNIDEIVHAAHAKELRKALILGREEAADILADMVSVLSRLGFDAMSETAFGNAVAKAVELDPDIYLIDVQLNGKHSAEFVNILRHLPQYNEQPIMGFCYYRVEHLGEDESRQQVLKIDEDVEKFLSAGGTSYIGRYSSEVLLSVLKEVVFQDGNTI